MIPDIIDGKYRVIREVGSGGMAHVYRAINMSSRKVVAVKMLKEEYLNDREFLRRFEREAKASLALSHENIVRAFGVGDDNGVPYIVLEYVEGKTLKELIQESPGGHLSVQQAIGICSQIMDALSYAHANGIIHRDVKPQNVIVTARGKAKLADFGIAREVTASTVTFSGKNVVGSVHYISPEQAKGLPVTEESDIYSTGISLYEMLTGTVPFIGDTTVATALMHLSETPTPPQELNPAIPPLSTTSYSGLSKRTRRCVIPALSSCAPISSGPFPIPTAPLPGTGNARRRRRPADACRFPYTPGYPSPSSRPYW